MEKFFKENYYLHLLVGLIIGFFATALLTGHCQFIDFGSIRPLIMFFFLCGAGFAKEWYCEAYLKAPFDWWDVIWSGIGGLIGCIIYMIV